MDTTNTDRAVSKYFFSEDNFTMMTELLSDVSWKKYSIRLTNDINVLVLDIMKATFDNRPSVREGSARSDYILLLNKLVLVRCMDVIRDELNESRSQKTEDMSEELDQTDNSAMQDPTAAEERSLKSGVSAKYNDLLKARQNDTSMTVPVDPNQAASVAGLRANFVIPKETDSNVLPTMIVDKNNDTVHRYEEIMKSREEPQMITKRSNKYPSALSPIPEGDEDDEPTESDAQVLYHMDAGTEDYVAISEEGTPQTQEKPIFEEGLHEAPDIQTSVKTRQSTEYNDASAGNDFERHLSNLLSTRDRDIGSLNFPKPTEDAIRQLQNISLSSQQKGLNSFWNAPDKIAPAETIIANPVAPVKQISVTDDSAMLSLQKSQTQMLEKLTTMTKNLEQNLSQNLVLMTRLVDRVDKEISILSSTAQATQSHTISSVDRTAQHKNSKHEQNTQSRQDHLDDASRFKLASSLHRDRSSETVFRFSIKLASSIKSINIRLLCLPLPANVMPVLLVDFNDTSLIIDRWTLDKDHISCIVPACNISTDDGTLSICVRDPFGANLATVNDVCVPTSVQKTGSTFAIETNQHHSMRTGERVIFKNLTTDDDDVTEWFSDATGHPVTVIDALHFMIDAHACPTAKGLVTSLGTIIKPKAQTLMTYIECV